MEKPKEDYTDGLVQDCSNSIANTLELLQSCAKPSIQPQASTVLFHNIFFSSGEQPEQRIAAHKF